MLHILQVRLQQYMNWELPDVQIGFWKGKGTRGQIANIRWIIEKAREFQKNIYFCFIDYAKALDYVGHNKLWKTLRDGSTRPLYLSPKKPVCRSKTTVRTGYGITDWFQIGKGVWQGWILSPILAYLTYIQSTLCEILGWMNQKLGSRLLGELSTTSDMQMIPF